ncbi:hypothetical protein JIN85_06060 [Luteolibacter pohnpeiensis]|uniref:Protein BatD n=1 Tax=Luteolibacter pohnpeiensis TaxID=454153 RepID=A0A934S650_9BACT|nr:hypothetical protein [Luteolibacter pohnpeiensis]MBK1881970.1 hypothetical protein [Luteolibacter pohnpeiensis]
MRFLCLFLALIATVSAAVPSQRIGQPLTLQDIYIPGGEAKPAPRRDREPPLVVRLLELKPAKDGFRYDFEIQGLEAGTYNLADFLVPVNSAEPPTFPEIPLEITSQLPPGIELPKVKPSEQMPTLGGYRTTMITLCCVWFIGLIAIILWKKKKPAASNESEAPASLADRLKPLLDAASNGKIDDAGRAKLERLILGHWRERLPEIADAPTSEAMVKLRQHPEASPLILALERWLHARNPETSEAEIQKLLAPYQPTAAAAVAEPSVKTEA